MLAAGNKPNFKGFQVKHVMINFLLSVFTVSVFLSLIRAGDFVAHAEVVKIHEAAGDLGRVVE